MKSQHMNTFLLAAVARLALAVDPLVDLSYVMVEGTALEMGTTQWLGVGYAAPPLGEMRFAAPVHPDITPDVVEDTSQFKPICLPRSPSDFTMQPNERFTVSEDCLYLNIFAPSNATMASNLPVMYFIQGGGFGSNSNANFNASDLALFGNMVVVQVNYRVGPFGFLQSEEVMAGGSLNNGLKDQRQGMIWLTQHVTSFGGDPSHIVAVGDSAGATSIALLLAAWVEEDPGLIKGAIMESMSLATIRTMEQGQDQYACLLNQTGCAGVKDSLRCLRSLDPQVLQTEQCHFNPHLDGDIIKTPMLTSFEEGRYLRVPTIVGSCTDEGTKSVPQCTETEEEALSHINNQAFGVLSDASLDLVRETYLKRDAPVFPSSGRLWRQLSDAHGDFRVHCVTVRVQDAMARDGVSTWNYRYAVLDDEQEGLGFGAYHTVELNGVFGPENTDGAPPKSYREGEANAGIVPVTMAYWAGFVRTLDPNGMSVVEGMLPEWMPWTVGGRERLRLQTNESGMEMMEDGQRMNCIMFDPMLSAIETPMEEGSVVELSMPSLLNETKSSDGTVETGQDDETTVVSGGTRLVGVAGAFVYVMIPMIQSFSTVLLP